MKTESSDNSALCRWVSTAISGSSDITYYGASENLVLARPEDVIAYVTPGYAESVLRDAKARFASPSVPEGFTAWKGIMIGERGVSPDHFRLYKTPAFPSYINSIVAKGALFQGILKKISRQPEVKLDDPVLHILHPQCRIYGHFLLEAVLKIPHLLTLQRMGRGLRVFIPNGFPDFVMRMLFEIFHKDDLLIASPGVNYAFRTVISPHLNQRYLLSQTQIDWCSTIFSESGDGGGENRLPGGDRLFLMRKTRNLFHHLGNINNVLPVMEASGFRAVFPETLSFSQQSRLFRRAKIVAGDYSSSLHNMIFSPPGTKLISFNYIGPVQTAIGLSRYHKIAYIAPQNVGFIENNSDSKPFTEYVIDIDELERVLADFC